MFLYFLEQELYNSLLLPVIAFKLLLQVGGVVHSYIIATEGTNGSAVELGVELGECDFVGTDVHVAVAVVRGLVLDLLLSSMLLIALVRVAAGLFALQCPWHFTLI